MPATYTTSLRLVKPATGDTGWGTTVNGGLTDLVDFSVAGTSTITMTATDHTLTNNNGATDEARAMFLTLSGTPGGSYNVICPAVSKLYFVTNSTGYAQTVKTASGTGISVPDGQTRALYCNGTNVVNAINSMGSLSLGSALGVASGGTGAGSFTTNYVLLGNGTSAFQTIAPGSSGNILTSNGTTWASSAPPVGGISYTKVTSTTTATDKQGLIADTGGGPFTINLPATPSTGFQVIIADGDNWAVNNLTVGRNGSTIENVAQDLVCDITGASVTLIYDGTTWEVFAQIGGAGGSAATITSTNTFTAAQIFRAASAVRSEAAATQDAVVLAGRAGGTSSYAVTLTPATLSANRTATLPDETFTVGFRNIPAVGTKSGSYSLGTGDVGKYVQVTTGGSITIPNSTFAEGDVVMVYNNTTGNITITCSTTNAYIAGTDTNKSSVTLATRGVANIFFYSSTACVITGNVT